MLAEAIIIAASIIFGAMSLVYMLARAKSDNGIVDMFYGLIFALVVVALQYLYAAPGVPQLLATLLVVIWGVRLSLRIFMKNINKPEDFRYAAWRWKWCEKGELYFALRSYTQIFLLQGAIVFIVLLPVLFLHALGEAMVGMTPLVVVGLLLWGAGFAFEAIADQQLDRFKAKPANRGKIMTEGLWRFSRRPNYFGEAVMWWGMWVLSLSALPLIPYGVVGLVSPILITYVLVAVTGPMLEERWVGNPRYELYKRQTSYFLPLPPRRIPEKVQEA